MERYYDGMFRIGGSERKLGKAKDQLNEDIDMQAYS